MKKIFPILITFVITLLFSVSPLSAGQLGININLAERGGTFTDVAREIYRWSRESDGEALAADDVDGHGWPAVDARLVIDYRPVAEWAGSIDDPQEYRIDVSGTYECKLTGQADISCVTGGSVSDVVYDENSNTTTFSVLVDGPPDAGHGFIILSFTNTKRASSDSPGTGFTNLRMMRPGYSLDTQKTFTDEFINALTGIGFGVIRFMNSLSTNGRDPDYPGVTEWADRKLKEDASQAPIPILGKTGGWSWEYIIELCNLAGMDPWINIPISATDEYVTNVAALFRDSLEPGLVVYVESSNEVWNTAPGFEQSLYNQAQADALGIGEHENHARRSVELVQLFESEYGAGSLNSSVRVILCSHKPMLRWWVEPMLEYIETNFGTPSDYLYAIACQTYFGGGAEEGESIDKILADCHENITGQIDESGGVKNAGRIQWVSVAQEWGLPGGFCSYEGGPDHGGGSTTNIANRILAERSEGMADEWTYNLKEGFFEAGGNIAAQFTLSSAFNRYGCWGLTDDITDPERCYKYGAARDLVNEASVQPGQTEPVLKTEKVKQGLEFFPSTRSFVFYTNPGEKATLSLYSVSGKRIATLFSGICESRQKTVSWNIGKSLSSGVFFALLETESGRSRIRGMVIE